MDLKTIESLEKVAGGLTFDGGVSEVLVGGSQANGSADLVSDLDLWVVANEWEPTSIGSLLLAGRVSPMGSFQLFHGITVGGLILDVIVGREPFPGYMPVEVEASADLSGPAPPGDVVADFWINSYKARKPLFRNLDAMVCFGLHHERMFLLRMWAMKDRGQDPGDSIFTISGLTPFIRDCLTPHRRLLLGLPCRDREEIFAAEDAYREEALSLFPAYRELADLVMGDPVYNGLKGER